MAERNESDSTSSPRLAVVLSVLDLLKSALWPGFALLLFISFYGPLYELAGSLPDLLGRAHVITIGQLNIKLNAALANEATQSVRDGLKGLDGATARRLLQLTDTANYCVDPLYGANDELAQDISADDQLQNLQMVTLTPQPPRDNAKCYQAAPTELGKKTQNLLLTLLANALTTKSG
jgi:hypothetical protein